MIARVTALGALVIAGALSVVALPADASTAYRYWSYWTADSGDTAWQYATEGSGTRVPSDGAVEGWRFGIAGDATRIQPATVPDFAAICGDVEAPMDDKRVAVVIDPGSPEEAPDNEAPGTVLTQCVVTASNATGLQILQTIASVRMDAGFVCGVNGYPAQECAPLVELPEAIDSAAAADAPASTTEDVTNISAQLPAESTSTGTPLITAATVSVLALVGFGIWRHRRREHA